MDKGIFIGASSRLKWEFTLCFNLHVTEGFRSTAGLPGRLTDVQVHPPFSCPGFEPFGCFRRRRYSGAWRHLSGIGGSCRTNWRTNSHTGSFTRSFIWRAGDLGRWAVNNNAHVVLPGWHFMKKRRKKGRFKGKSFIRRQSSAALTVLQGTKSSSKTTHPDFVLRLQILAQHSSTIPAFALCAYGSNRNAHLFIVAEFKHS